MQYWEISCPPKCQYQKDSRVRSLDMKMIYPACTDVVKFLKCFPVIINLFTDNNAISIIPRDLIGHIPFLSSSLRRPCSVTSFPRL